MAKSIMSKPTTVLSDAELDLVTGGCGCEVVNNNGPLNSHAQDNILNGPAGQNGFQGNSSNAASIVCW